jgi:hypothetical protein
MMHAENQGAGAWYGYTVMILYWSKSRLGRMPPFSAQQEQ